MKSDVRSEIQRIIPNINAIVNSLLDRQIGLNELKVRDVLAKAVAVRTSLNFFYQLLKIPKEINAY